jgi:hypothetical protein
LVGCSGGISDAERTGVNNTTDKALLYLEQKYGEKFSYAGSFGSGYVTPGSSAIFVTCESLPNDEIALFINEKDGTYADNYIDHKFREKTEGFLFDIACKYFNVADVKVGIAGFPTLDGIDNTTPFEDYIHNEKLIIEGEFDVVGWNEKDVVSFLDDLKEQGIHFSFGFVVESDVEEYFAQYLRSDSAFEIKEKVLN